MPVILSHCAHNKKKMKSAQQEECILCCREIEIYATGACDHHVCYECSTRMRVLCETNECPVCRSNMPAVVFTLDRQLFSDVSKKFSLCFKKYNIIFEDEEVADAFDRLLEHKCKLCDNVLPTFEKLREHVRRTHELHYCELCTEHLKIFTFERKCYSRKDLARHKRHGDPDEKSHRGHPLCEYCDQRYVDADELFRHLRKEHFYCHFCDADGIYHYYKDYEYLRNHFRMEHYLCEEGSCINETFTSAFRSEIDLKAHIAVHHSKNKTRAEAKQARMLDFEFAYAHNRPSGSSSPRGGRYSQNRRRNVEENISQNRTKADQQPEPENIDTQSVQEFPYLSEDSTNSDALTLQSYCRNIKRNVMSAEDFPALSSATITTPSESFNNQSRKVNVSTNPPQVQKRNVMSIEDFPALSSNTTPTSPEGLKNQGKKNNITKSNTASKTSNMATQPALWGVPTQNISASSSDSKFKKVDVENGDRASQPKSKWSTKKSDFNFEEEFPSLEVKKNPLAFAAAASVPKVSSSTSKNSSMHRAAAALVPKVSSSTSNNSSMHQVPNVVAPKKSVSSNIDNTDSASGDHFVIIKTKSKNKKQPKVYAPADYETAEETKPVSFNKINMVRNDENKNTFKKHLMEPTAPSKPKPSDTWGDDNLSFGNEDFPPLAPKEPLKKPPGLSITKSRAPPPGFTANSTITNSSIANKTLADVAREIVLPNTTNGFNHQESSNQDTFQEYREPQNFVQRNNELIQKIIDLSNAQAILFEEFKIASGKFRRNEISAREYHAKCLNILGQKAIIEIFPELVSLLPDIRKQQELLTVHNTYLSQINRGAVSKKPYKLNNFVVSCQKCKQVLEISDCKNHELLHIRNGSQ
ncbi:e3 ubiquitin-protein ligase ZNF598 [Trichonephila clavata]|uniref:RING-type E3 ubiquitin transferase n=1 Tax=Trichonephila clavata TaxID=2740835 RepID=A0A8X6IG83_TRICU|nr:e3 ubiquitin-protein ligase ZNF598 [Trichonephila clavata]